MKHLILVTIAGFMMLSCTDTKSKASKLAAIETLQKENDSLKNVMKLQQGMTDQKIMSFLTFQKEDAEQAMNFYMALFDNSKIVNLQRWGKGMPGKEGTIMHATFMLDGNVFMCSDSPPVHKWDFTPAVSNYVECKDENELERLFSKLSENGTVTMPLNNYGFSQKFGWVVDQFGVSWQLNLQ